MYLSHLSLTNFRNFSRLELDLSEGITLVQGENAQGKTSFLEAVAYLSTSRSLLATTERELVHWLAWEEPLPFARLVGESGVDARLRIVGSPDARYPEAGEAARRLGVADRVEWSGYLDDAGLVKAYRDADALALLSRYEGFGLPVLEAMACGTPVVCSDAASLPEVAGNAARLVAPGDVAGAAAALKDVLTAPAEAARLRAAGLAQAKTFSWRTAAEAMLRLYGELAP